MLDYRVIPETSKVILEMLHEKLCENGHPVAPANVKFITPNDTSVDYHVGLHLYDVREIFGYQQTAPITNENTRVRPPKMLELHYMLFSNPKAQNTITTDEEHAIFSRALQVIYDAGNVPLPESEVFSIANMEGLMVSFVNHSLEDKIKIWSAFQSPYRLSIFFTVSPVILPSRRIDVISRVTKTTVKATQSSSLFAKNKG